MFSSDRTSRFCQSIRTASGRLAAVVLVLAVMAGTPAAAMQAEAVATLEKGFGRIVLTFKDRILLPQYVSNVSNGVLVLQFPEGVDVKVDRLPTDLAQYVMVARRDPDGQALRIALQQRVRVNVMEAGEKLFVDLLPPTWKGAPPALPEAVIRDLAQRADAAIKEARAADAMRFGVKILPKIDFRIGRQPTFTRFSFGWNMPFDTQMTREADRVKIMFNRLSQIDIAGALVDPPPGLKEIQVDDSNEKLTVILVVTPEADVRGFRDDQTYVVDLAVPGAAGARVAAQVPAMGADAQTPAKAREKVELGGNHGAAEPAAAKAPAGLAPSAKSKEAPLPPEEPVVAAAHDDGHGGKTPPAAPHEGEDEPKGSGELPPDIRDAGPVAQTMVRAEAKRIGSVVRVTFPFRDKVASAAFKRENNLFVVFDTKLPVDTKALRAVLGAQASDVAVEKLAEGSLVRIALTEPQLTTLGADGNNWILSIGELVLEPARPLKLERVLKPGGRGTIRIAMPDGGKVHTLVDPAIGDRIVVVTAMGPARGILKPHGFAELDAIPSAHGIALVPKVDDLSVLVDPSGVAVMREDGLSLSPGDLKTGELQIPKSERAARKIVIEGNGFLTQDPGEFAMRHRELMDRIATAPEQQRTAARLQLAQFFLAHRFAPEAMGVLRRAAEEEPGIIRDPGFVVLFAAAQALTGRTDLARKALARSDLSENPDAALWRTIAAADAGKWDEAHGNSDKALTALATYPPDIQALFRMAAAQAEIEMNVYAAAQSHLAQIDTTDIDDSIAAKVEVLQGRVADAAGRPDDALERYRRAGDKGNRAMAAEAEYRTLRQLVRDDKIEKEEAITRLKALSFAWRGDEIELRTLRFLGNMQAEQGHYRDAFTSMRSAVQVGPDAEPTRLLQDEMGHVFTALFLDGKADGMEPLDALTLYYDFRDLMPIGRMGDEIVRKLADRLVAVDLLDQAGELLSYQVDNRLKGAARAQIAADLAVIHLLDRKPDRALAVLNKTRQSGLSASVDRQRRIVEARALADAGRTELAIELAKNLSGSDVERLRGDIFWKAKRWSEAGERLEVMLGGRWNDAAALDDQERQDVLRAAISYALANDQLSLDRFRAKYQAKMLKSPSANAFDVVTQPIQSMGSDFRDVARRMSTVDTLRGFVDEYRGQYLKTKPEPSAGEPGKGEPKPVAAKPEEKAPPKAEAKADPAKKVAMADPPAKAEAAPKKAEEPKPAGH